MTDNGSDLTVVLEFGGGYTWLEEYCNKYELRSNILVHFEIVCHLDLYHVFQKYLGGAELLFNKSKKHIVRLSGSQKPWTIKKLLSWLKDNLLTGNAELFFQGDSVRPGILVLVNETDWELMDTLDYEINNYDCLMFLSTLHGG